VSQDDLFGAPAGWYPDPLGLPQLRWWNNHSWTEQTSAARQPMVMQDTKFAWADDELPTRREERERERQRADRAPAAQAKPTAATLRELEPPRAFTKIETPETFSPGAQFTAGDQFRAEEQAQPAAASAQSIFDAPVFTAAPAEPTLTPSAQSLFDAQTPFDGQKATDAQPLFDAPPAASTTAPAFGSLFDAAPTTPAGAVVEETLDRLFGQRSPGEAAAARRATPIVTDTAVRGSAVSVNTAPAWIIAMIPLFQLVLSLLLLTALGMGSNVAIFLAILAVPYLIVVGLAYFDQRALLAAGVDRPAHWAWAFLTAPVYLLMRARAVIRQSGHGIGPVLVWFGLGALHLASVVAIPGLLIAILPAVFTSQLQASVESDALLISGAQMTVTCPATPPVLFGEQTVCDAVSANGNESEIAVSLERANGWIQWQVLDWGVWGVDR
jgi:hypothetical protein